MVDSAEVRELAVLIKIHMATGGIYYVNGVQDNNNLSVARNLMAGKKVHSIG